jgi:hypothetical protein
VTPTDQEVESFVRSTFRSVWSLELLLFLKRNCEQAWSRPELVDSLRASDAVIAQSVDALLAAGLITMDEQAVRYGPAASDLEGLTQEAESLYARSPGAVRRMIVIAATDGLAAFSDAFRLRKD